MQAPTRKKIIEKALKLQALAERGVGGEKENAKIMLHEYKIKHCITENELKRHKPFDLKNFTAKDIEELFGSVESDLGKIIVLGLSIFGAIAYAFNDQN